MKSVIKEDGKITGPEVLDMIVNTFFHADGSVIQPTDAQVQGVLDLFGGESPVSEEDEV